MQIGGALQLRSAQEGLLAAGNHATLSLRIA